MGYKLKKREYDYNESLFKGIGIQVQEVEGRNFLEISNIIAKNYRRLSIKCHPDKPGGSNEKIQALNRDKAALLQYIKPLSANERIIIFKEMQRYLEQIKQGKNDKRTKYYYVFSFVNLLSGILLLASYIYLGFKLYKAANFTDTPGILFSASLITFVTTSFLFAYLISSLIKEIVDSQNSQREQGENLDQEEMQEKILKSKKLKYLTLISQYPRYLSPILLIVGLALQYQSSCVDSKVLIGFAAVLGCTLLLQLVTEIYERKVVDLIKTETEQVISPDSTIDSNSVFSVSSTQAREAI